MISTVISCFVEFNTYNLPCVSVMFWLISIARFVFKGQNMTFTVNVLHLRCCDAGHWELFASTVGRFLSWVSYLSSYVFLRSIVGLSTKEIQVITDNAAPVTAKRPWSSEWEYSTVRYEILRIHEDYVTTTTIFTFMLLNGLLLLMAPNFRNR